MKTSRNRYVLSSWLQCIAPLVACLVLVLFTTPDRPVSVADDGFSVPEAVDASTYAKLQELIGRHGKGLDRGTFELFQIQSPLPTAWVWVEDDTADGLGVEYWAIHPSFIAPGPGAPDVGLEYTYRPEVNHMSLQEFLDWIVENNPHVTDADELLVYRSEATPI